MTEEIQQHIKNAEELCTGKHVDLSESECSQLSIAYSLIAIAKLLAVALEKEHNENT